MSMGDKVAHVKAARQTRDHRCHWIGCEKQVPPAMWGCTRHWYTLPRSLRTRIWRAYTPGQEDGGSRPSPEYLEVAREVQAWIEAYQRSEETK